MAKIKKPETINTIGQTPMLPDHLRQHAIESFEGRAKTQHWKKGSEEFRYYQLEFLLGYLTAYIKDYSIPIEWWVCTVRAEEITK